MTARFSLVTLATLAIALAAGGAGGAAPAQDPAPAGAAPLRLTLPDAIARALATSHRVGEFEARQDAARAVVAGRASADMPVVSVLGGYTRTNHVDEFAVVSPGQPRLLVYPDVPDNWRLRLDAMWPIFSSGGVQALERAARSDEQAAGKDVDTTRADTRLDAARAFWALVTATEAVRVVASALDLVDAHLRDVRNMRAVGLLAPNDVLSVEAQRSREQVLLIEARNARDVAEADLRRVTGIPPEVPIEIDAVLEGPMPDLPAPDALLAEARAKRPERQALQLRIDGLSDRGVAAAAALKPTIALGGGLDYARPNPRHFPRADEWASSWDASVNLLWPLWDGGRVRADVAGIGANERAARQRLADLDTVLAFEVRQRSLDLHASRAAIAAATDGVASATEARRVVGERFKAGLVTTTEVLDAQVAMLQAQLDRTRALAALRIAEARLDRTLGR